MRNFPHWLKTYCSFTATSEAPLDFHFWTGVSTIAATLNRRVWRDEIHYKWTPNFYIIFVGPAGVVTKSTTLNIGYRLLRQVPAVHFGPDSMTWHGLAKKFQQASSVFEWTDPAGKKIKIPTACLTCSVSELGTFLRPDDKALISFLTDVWDGKEREFIHAVQDASGISIENAWLNVIGATTPAWIQENFPPSLLSEGIGSRIIFVYGDTKRLLVPYPSRAVKAADHADIEKKLIADLIWISENLKGPYDLTSNAYQWGHDWYIAHQTKRTTTLASNRYGGYLARKQTHLHKLAMVLSAAQRDELLIHRRDLVEAEKILGTAEASMIRVFENVGTVDVAKHIVELVSYVRAYGWISRHDLYRQVYNIMSEKDFLAAIHNAVQGDLLQVTKDPTGVTANLGLSMRPKKSN